VVGLFFAILVKTDPECGVFLVDVRTLIRIMIRIFFGGASRDNRQIYLAMVREIYELLGPAFYNYKFYGMIHHWSKGDQI